LKISVIIPAKDEENRLPVFLKTLIAYCRQSSHVYEILVVDDGSRDRTASCALAFQQEFPSIQVLSLERNHGKGYAVKQGFASAQGDVVLFLDADGSTGPDEIERHLSLFEEGYDVVIGSRVLTDEFSQIKARPYRQWMGSIFNLLVSSFLLKGIKDTQCGFKMFRGTIVRDIFSRVYLEGFGFDLEVLYLATQGGYRIKEVPISWSHVPGSKVHIIKDSCRMFWNIIQIRMWHSKKK